MSLGVSIELKVTLTYNALHVTTQVAKRIDADLQTPAKAGTRVQLIDPREMKGKFDLSMHMRVNLPKHVDVTHWCIEWLRWETNRNAEFRVQRAVTTGPMRLTN
jgi:hypothetical protein